MSDPVAAIVQKLRDDAAKEQGSAIKTYRECVASLAGGSPLPAKQVAALKDAMATLGIAPDTLATDVTAFQSHQNLVAQFALMGSIADIEKASNEAGTAVCESSGREPQAAEEVRRASLLAQNRITQWTLMKKQIAEFDPRERPTIRRPVQAKPAAPNPMAGVAVVPTPALTTDPLRWLRCCCRSWALSFTTLETPSRFTRIFPGGFLLLMRRIRRDGPIVNPLPCTDKGHRERMDGSRRRVGEGEPRRDALMLDRQKVPRHSMNVIAGTCTPTRSRRVRFFRPDRSKLAKLRLVATQDLLDSLRPPHPECLREGHLGGNPQRQPSVNRSQGTWN